jgi:WD40 repeat protein
MSLKTGAFVVMFLFITSGVSSSETSFNLLQLDQDGAMIISSWGEIIEIPMKQRHIGDVSFGILVGHKFYTISDDKDLRITDLKAMETKVLIDIKKRMDVSCRPFSVQFVDDNRIIIEALKYDKTKYFSKDTTFPLFQYDRRVGDINRMPINKDNGPVSVYEERVYYTGQDGNVYFHEGSTEQSLRIKGTSPTISPDGRRLAYIFSGPIKNSINIYDIETKKTQSIISFFNSINPRIRWSHNSRLLAMSTINDLYVTPLYVIDAMTGEIVHKFKKSFARNWFFIEDKW